MIDKPEDNDKNGSVEWLAQQLREKEAIIDGISDALMLVDAKTLKILDVNQAFLNSYGISRDEVLGKRCHEVTHHLKRPCNQVNSHCPCPLVDSVLSGNFSHAEHIHRDHDGKTLYFEITTYPLKDKSGKVTRIIHLSRDITLRKSLEHELMEKEKLSGILELAGGASHEINQPLTVIITGLERLVKRLPQGNVEYDIALTILESAKRLSKISEKLGQITRYASKEYVAGKRIIDLDEASNQKTEH
ncbi:MAG: PAS domain-containing protein [Pseudomonadota bacterium]